MSVISGFKDIKNLLNSKVQPCTAQYIGRNRQGIDTVPNLFYFAHDPAVFPWTASAGTNKSVTATGLCTNRHSRAGDVVRFLTGSLVEEIIFVQSINTATDTITFSQEMAAAAAAGDTFELLRPTHGDVVTPASSIVFGNLLKTGVYDTVAGGWIPFPVASGAFPTVSNFEATDTQYPNAPTTLARIGGLVDDTSSTTVAENTMGTPRITPKRAFHVNLRNDSGTEIGTASNALRTDPVGTTAQPASVLAPTATTATITANGQSQTVTLSGAQSLVLQYSGTYASVQLQFEATWDGTNYVAIYGYSKGLGSYASQSPIDSNQTRIWAFNVIGATIFRVRSTAYGSGTQNIRFLPCSLGNTTSFVEVVNAISASITDAVFIGADGNSPPSYGVQLAAYDTVGGQLKFLQTTDVAPAGNEFALITRDIPSGAPTGTEASVAASASSVTILAANAVHKGRSVRNDSTAILYLRLSAGAATSSSSIKLLAGETFFIEPGEYAGIIVGIWASATGNARVWEGT